jgi:iron complex outermembrane recepter protein
MKNARFRRKALALSVLSASFLPVANSPFMPEAQAAAILEEIIVTARKREESMQDVPVAISAFGRESIRLRNINSVDNLARAVPNLLISEGGGTVQGGNIVMRGISGADANPLGDQAVSFNFDGVQVARASVRRMSEMDIEQITVLKGPQALFYGKNSPGGVISIKTADPTDEFVAGVSTGFESEAEEWRTDGYISGPISDTVGYRIAGFYSSMDGWVNSLVPDSNPIQPSDDPAPAKDEWAIRGTLKFEPSDVFDAKLKVTYGEVDGGSSTANVQYIDCPGGTARFAPLDDCEPDNHVSVAEAGPINAAPDFPADGKGYQEQEQWLLSGEMNYDLSDDLTLSSVTGFYSVDLENLGQYTNGYLPFAVLPSLNLMKIEEVSQELRLTSDFEGPLNFMLGGFYQDSRAETGSHTFLGTEGVTNLFGAPAPLPVNWYYLEQDGEAWSVFTQVQYNITEQLELSLGVRYSEEEKTLDSMVAIPFGSPNPPVELEPLVDNAKFDDTSPEVSLTWKPNDQHTIYGSYKEGFLSGGFNGSSGTSTQDITYDQQMIDGFEFGLKSTFLDGALQTNLAFYTYEIDGLQVVVTTQGTLQQLRNAGAVSSDGVEFDFNYQTPLDGLAIYGAMSYNDAQYDDYQASCYAGQTATSSVPCINQISRVTGQLGLLQDLSGTDLVRAPEWSGNFGFHYRTDLNDTLDLNVLGNVSFSDDYLTDPSSKEWARSPSYELVDLTFAVSDRDERWEIAFIGKNLTEEYYWSRNADVPFSNLIAGGVADSAAAVSRGREFWLKFSYKFGG